MPIYNNVNFLSQSQQVKKNQQDIKDNLVIITFTTLTNIQLLTELDISDLTNIEYTPKVGDIVVGNANYYGQITATSTDKIYFVVIGQIQYQSGTIIDTTNYKIIAGVIRNTGAGWEFIDDAGHSPINIDSISEDATKITIGFSGISATKVGSLVVVPDDTFQGIYTIGASVTTNTAFLYISKNNRTQIGGYIKYSGGVWNIANNNGNLVIDDTNFGTTGELTISHDTALLTSISATGRSGTCIPNIGSSGETFTDVYLYDYAGALITTPTNQKFYFSRAAGGGTGIDNEAVDPTSLVSANGNFWIYGIMHI